MTATQTGFLAAIARRCAELSHISSGGLIADCIDCQYETGQTCEALAALSDGERELWQAPYFGKCGCDTCGATTHGMRESGHAMADGVLVHLALCEDCVLYFGAGIVPELWEG